MTVSCHIPAATPLAPPLGAVTVLLVGRPNSGKSSLFNVLTGGQARVGNFPGITVDAMEGDVVLPGGRPVRIVDLPGTYSLGAALDPASDEGLSRRYIERVRQAGGPVLLAQVLDSTNLALSLRLTAELLRLGLPLVLLVSQRDVLETEGRPFDAAGLEEAVGVPVLWVSALAGDTRARLLEALERWSSEGVPVSGRRLSDPQQVARRVLGGVTSSAPRPLALHRRTARLDDLLMHPLAGPVIFLLAMASLFTAVFLVADPASFVVGGGVDLLARSVRSLTGDGMLASFLCDGVLAGAGTVIQFLPQIVLLTVALELIESSGYLARGAYLLDRLLRAVGLGGRSFVPLLMGHACAVPAITATRTIREPGQRLKTMLVLPLMTCSARVPAYALLISTFFPGLSAVGRALLFLALYGVGLLGAAVASLVIGGTVMRGRRSLPLVIELPPYRTPQAAVVARAAWRSGVRFARDVGTMIVAVSAVLWALLAIPAFRGGDAGATASTSTRLEQSVAGRLGKVLEPLTAPIGFDWRINVGLIGSFGARELMVSTMGVIFGVENADDEQVTDLSTKIRNARRPDGSVAYTTATGLALLAFFVIACQCMSTIAALRRETHGWRWPLFVIGYTYVAAYGFAFAVFHVARLLGA